MGAEGVESVGCGDESAPLRIVAEEVSMETFRLSRSASQELASCRRAYKRGDLGSLGEGQPMRVFLDVMFEAGFLIGKSSKKKVRVELPANVIVEMTAKVFWRSVVLTEPFIKEVGWNVAWRTVERYARVLRWLLKDPTRWAEVEGLCVNE
eukprot:48150-Eustigmatos_ZCMA.PRE.2